jgi:hypothetical protein
MIQHTYVLHVDKTKRRNCVGIVEKTRLFILLGWSRADGYDDDEVVWHLVFKIKPELEKIRDELLDHKMSLIFYSVKMYLHDVEQEAFSNMKLAIGSFSFIFIFMWLQTSSLWISFFGILSIVTSFLFTNLIYRFVTGSKGDGALTRKAAIVVTDVTNVVFAAFL